MFVLVGDIGGTNTRLAIFDGETMIHKVDFVNASMPNFEACLSHFLSEVRTSFSAASFGVAGPLNGGQIEMTNLSWVIDEAALEQTLGVPAKLLNDFHIQALGTTLLKSEDYRTIGMPRITAPDRLAVIGAGTGLGEALLIRHHDDWVVIPGEGGHKRFAPKNEREIDLLRSLSERWPEHVSVERVVSGPGLVNTYEALLGDLPRHPRMFGENPAAVISDEALTGGCHLCEEVLDIFVDTLADEAANLVLQSRADCLYISGGIPNRIFTKLAERFRQGFEAKGRYRTLLEKTEIRVVNRPNMALEGAAFAARVLATRS